MSFFLKCDHVKKFFRITDADGIYADLPNRFLRAIELRGLSSHTVRAYGYDIVMFYRWMKETGRNLKTLKENDLMEFIAFHRERNSHPKTINRRLLTCRLLYQYCFNKPIPSSRGVSRPSRHFIGMLYDPYLGIIRVRKGGQLKVRVKEQRKIIEPLTADQVNAFLRRISRYRDLAIVLLMLLCGLRSNEVLLLRLGDISFTQRQMRVRGKGNKERLLPLPQMLINVIQKFLKHERPVDCTTDNLVTILQGTRRSQPMTSAGLRSLFRSRRKTEILQSAHPHKMRHTFGADMARSGVSLPTLQKMMGHSTPMVTHFYIELSLDDVKVEYERAMEKLKNRYAPNLQG